MKTLPTTALTTAACAAIALGTAGTTQAQTSTDFDGFANGSVDGQFGWNASNANFDQEIVDLGGGNKVWRMSNAYATGGFGDQPHSGGTGLYHGESSSTHQPSSNVANTDRFYTSFDFKSATGAAQTGLFLSVTPDDGAGSRQSYVGLSDSGTGIDVLFYDAQDNHATNPNGGFVLTTVASGLSYSDWHNIELDIQFVDGVNNNAGTINGNDIVTVTVNGTETHTGTTWESYYQTTTEGQTPPSVRAIDQLLFRAGSSTGTTTTPALDGGGFYFDNVEVSNVPEPGSLALLGAAGALLLTRRRRRA